MMSYNPRTKELFTWDKGNQLIYPIKQVAIHPYHHPFADESRSYIDEIFHITNNNRRRRRK